MCVRVLYPIIFICLEVFMLNVLRQALGTPIKLLLGVPCVSPGFSASDPAPWVAADDNKYLGGDLD